MKHETLTALARRLGRECLGRGATVATAESCTGGGLAEAITRIPGSSEWFERGFVTYSNAAKEQSLGVPRRTLVAHGAVSEEVARAMAAGVLVASGATLGVAITGVAGPGGGSREKPVGLVWIAWAKAGKSVQARSYLFKGTRLGIRSQAVRAALRGLLDLA